MPDKNADTFHYTQIAVPSEFILITEANTGELDANLDGTPDQTGSRVSLYDIDRSAGSDDPPGRACVPARHGKLANVLFADMHLEALPAGLIIDRQPDGTWVLERQAGTDNVNFSTSFWTLPDDPNE